MFKSLLVAILACTMLSGAAQNVAGAQSTSTTGSESLYKQLGGYDAIAAVTDDFIHRLATDDRFKKFFVGVSDEHKARIRQMAVDLICAKTGGPCIYVGRDLKEVHTGLHITDADFKASADLLKQSLDKYKVPPAVQARFLEAISSLKPDIVVEK
jgi:hemoglobin